MTILSRLILILLIALPLAAEAKERLVIGISQYPSTLHPAYDSMLAKTYIMGMTRRPISTISPDWEDVCMLCTALPDLEKGTAKYYKTADGKDGIAVTYTLDDKAVWGDGTPLTTKDIEFTWKVGHNPQSGFDNYELFKRIEKVEIKDAYTFTLYINKRSCEYKGLTQFYILPAHMEAALFDPKAAKQYRPKSLYERDPTNPALWFGPYRVAQIQPGQSITLVRNEHWWGKKPYFDEIELRSIENTAALTANLPSGDIDMIAGELGLTIDQAIGFERRYGDNYQIIYKPGLVYEHVDLRLDNPVLADKRLRQALLYGINREAISQNLFAGKQPVANGSVHPLDVVYDPDVKTYAYDPAKAAELLDAAGWKKTGRYRSNAAGERLTFEVNSTAGSKNRELVEQVLQSQWKELGIDLTIRNEPPRVLFGENISKRKFKDMALFAWISSPRNIPRSTLYSGNIPSDKNGWTGQNYTGFDNAEMDQVLDDLELKCGETENRALWNRAQEIYAEELPALPLYFRANTYILPKGLKGLTPTGHQFPSTLWVENWHMEN